MLEFDHTDRAVYSETYMCIVASLRTGYNREVACHFVPHNVAEIEVA